MCTQTNTWQSTVENEICFNERIMQRKKNTSRIRSIRTVLSEICCFYFILKFCLGFDLKLTVISLFGDNVSDDECVWWVCFPKLNICLAQNAPTITKGTFRFCLRGVHEVKENNKKKKKNIQTQRSEFGALG